MLSDLIVLTEPPAARQDANFQAKRKAAQRSLDAARRSLQQRAEGKHIPGAGFPYDNGVDAFASITCTDSTKPDDIAAFPRYAANAEKRAKYFGAIWVWNGPFCAANAFSAADEDAYRGDFTKRTVNPLLFVGNYWDPATRYEGAVSAASRAPNSRLLSSDSWGHTAYGSTSVPTPIGSYLISVKLPAEGPGLRR